MAGCEIELLYSLLSVALSWLDTTVTTFKPTLGGKYPSATVNQVQLTFLRWVWIDGKRSSASFIRWTEQNWLLSCFLDCQPPTISPSIHYLNVLNLTGVAGGAGAYSISPSEREAVKHLWQVTSPFQSPSDH